MLDYKIQVVDFKDNILTLLLTPKLITIGTPAKGLFTYSQYIIPILIFETFILSLENREKFFIDNILPHLIQDEPEDNED